MPGFRQFIKNLERRGQQVSDNTEKIVRAVALEVDATVVQDTPVETGRARSNWITQLNGTAEGEVGDAEITQTGNIGIAKSIATIGRYNIDTDSAIHISNNLPYIGQLNAGSSTQAPRNFVQKALVTGTTIARNSRLLR